MTKETGKFPRTRDPSSRVPRGMHIRKCADIENHQQRLQRHSPRFTGLATTRAERACYKNQEIKQPTLQLWVERDKSTSIWWLQFKIFISLYYKLREANLGRKQPYWTPGNSKNWLKKQQKKTIEIIIKQTIIEEGRKHVKDSNQDKSNITLFKTVTLSLLLRKCRKYPV